MINSTELAEVISAALKKIAGDLEVTVKEREDSFLCKGKTVASAEDLSFEAITDAKRGAVLQCEAIVNELSQEILHSLAEASFQATAPTQKSRREQHPIEQSCDTRAWSKSINLKEGLLDSICGDQDEPFHNPLTGEIIHPAGPFTPGSSIGASTKRLVLSPGYTTEPSISFSEGGQSLTPVSLRSRYNLDYSTHETIVGLTPNSNSQLNKEASLVEPLNGNLPPRLPLFPDYVDYVLELKSPLRDIEISLEDNRSLVKRLYTEIPKDDNDLKEPSTAIPPDIEIKSNSSGQLEQDQTVELEKRVTEFPPISDPRKAIYPETRAGEVLLTTKRGVMLELERTRARILKLQAPCGPITETTEERQAERRPQPIQRSLTARKAIFERNLDVTRRLEQERQQKETDAKRRRAEAQRVALEREKLKQQRIKEAEERQRRARQAPCSSCLEYFDKYQMSMVPCQHLYCHDCIRKAFSDSLLEKKPFQCCKTEFPLQSIMGFLDPDIAAQYQAMIIEISAPQPLYCAVKRCSKWIPPGQIHADVGTCTTCGARSCKICRNPMHSGVCELDAVGQLLLSLAKDRGWKQCPFCGTLVERTQGCLHITCKCRFEFCYNCTKPWKNCGSTCQRLTT